jgi:hypothetical protein
MIAIILRYVRTVLYFSNEKKTVAVLCLIECNGVRDTVRYQLYHRYYDKWMCVMCDVWCHFCKMSKISENVDEVDEVDVA